MSAHGGVLLTIIKENYKVVSDGMVKLWQPVGYKNHNTKKNKTVEVHYSKYY